MKIARLAFAAAALAPLAAQAAPLTVVEVSAPQINCVFDTTCTVIVNDSTGNLLYSPLGQGAFLQSRSFAAKANAPAANHTAYLYRVDLRNGESFTECLVGLVLNTGPVATFNYKANTPSQVFVVTQGGLGDVGIASAEQNGSVITFTFKGYLCKGHTSFFFGLAAQKTPMSTTATLFGIGMPPFVQTAARVPQH